MNLELVRFAYLPDVTLGILRIGDLRLCTLEEPWRPDPDGPGGQQGVSCVPDGGYSLYAHNGTRFKDVFGLRNAALGVYRQPQDIPAGQKYGRSAVLIHAGNSVDDIEGCMLVGMRHAILDGRHVVLESRKALERFKALVPSSTEHNLFIRPTKGTQENAA